MERSDEVFCSEFIGKYVEVKAKNIAGKIVDETKNSFLIKTVDGMKKMLLKGNNIFEIKMHGRNIAVDGKSILIKPEDRIKIKNEK